MKKTTVLAVLALLMMPLFSQTMEQKRKLEAKSQESGEPRKKKIKREKNEVQLQQEENSLVQIDPSWDGCPLEVKAHILSIVLDLNVIMSATAKNDKKTILEYMGQWVSLQSVSKEMNCLALDKRVCDLKKINKNMLECFPELFLKWAKKALRFKCSNPLKLPSSLVLRKEQLSSTAFDLLAIASSRGHINFCKKLILAGVIEDVQENISLIHAIYLRKKDVVEKLIELGRNKASFKNGANQLMMASEVGDIDIVKLLLKGNPDDLNAEADDGRTALIIAASKGYKEIVELLLDKGAAVNFQNNDGQTALMRAAFYGHREIVELLLKNGAVDELEDNWGENALISAAVRRHTKIIELLLDTGAIVDSRGQEGATVLIEVAFMGYNEAVKLLLNKGAKIDLQDNNGMTALMHAVGRGHAETVKLLLGNGADLNQKNCENGMTALMYEAFNGHEVMVELLLNAGASVYAQDNHGRTALSLALAKGHQEIVQLLQNHLDSLN